MASGKTHEKFNFTLLVIAIAFFIIILDINLTMEVIFLLLGYVIGTKYLTPDLDVKSRSFYRWGFLRFIWIPYQTFKHRSIWTHGYIFGDIIRVLYLFGWATLLILIYSFISEKSFIQLLNISIDFIIRYKFCLLAFIAGNIFSSTAHIILDHTSTFTKKIQKKYRT